MAGKGIAQEGTSLNDFLQRTLLTPEHIEMIRAYIAAFLGNAPVAVNGLTTISNAAERLSSPDVMQTLSDIRSSAMSLDGLAKVLMGIKSYVGIGAAALLTAEVALQIISVYQNNRCNDKLDKLIQLHIEQNVLSLEKLYLEQVNLYRKIKKDIDKINLEGGDGEAEVLRDPLIRKAFDRVKAFLAGMPEIPVEAITRIATTTHAQLRKLLELLNASNSVRFDQVSLKEDDYREALDAIINRKPLESSPSFGVARYSTIGGYTECDEIRIETEAKLKKIMAEFYYKVLDKPDDERKRFCQNQLFTELQAALSSHAVEASPLATLKKKISEKWTEVHKRYNAGVAPNPEWLDTASSLILLRSYLSASEQLAVWLFDQPSRRKFFSAYTRACASLRENQGALTAGSLSGVGAAAGAVMAHKPAPTVLKVGVTVGGAVGLFCCLCWKRKKARLSGNSPSTSFSAQSGEEGATSSSRRLLTST